MSGPMDPFVVRCKLQQWALQVRARFGFPVYLVGSVLGGNEWPRDIDVRVVMPDDHFEARFGDQNTERGKWRWAQEMGKLNWWAAHYGHLPVDFQVMRKSEARHYRNRPRKRLDVQRVRI